MEKRLRLTVRREGSLFAKLYERNISEWELEMIRWFLDLGRIPPRLAQQERLQGIEQYQAESR